MRECDTNFRYVNHDGLWPGFAWSGLERSSDGTLQLRSLPRATGVAARTSGAAPAGPGGIAIDWDGSIFYSVPAQNRIYRIDGCTETSCPAPCVGVRGDPLSELETPRGLLISAHRRALYIADAGHHRILIVDPESGGLQGALGALGLPHAPEPSDEPGRFNEPWAIAADPDGNVYVVDHGNHRVQKFDPTGTVDPLFWDRMQAEHVLAEPAGIAVAGGDEPRVFVLDRANRRIHQFDQHGVCIRDPQGNPWEISERLDDAMGLATTATALFVGDNARRRVLQFRLGDRPSFSGEAVGFDGYVAALAIDPKRGLLVHNGSVDAPAVLSIDEGHGSIGLLWGGPFSVDCPELTWRHVWALASVPERAHLEFFYRMSPTMAGVDPTSDDPFPAAGGWRRVGLDLTDFFVNGDRTEQVWIAARFSGDGTATATLSQIRLQFDRDSYLKSLPVIYQEETGCGDFADRYLALFESEIEPTEEAIRRLPALADPDAVSGANLSWLASWLGLDLDEHWDEQTKRDAIRHAYARFATRGTARGLRDAIEREAGVHVVVHEPLVQSGWWALPGRSTACGGDRPEWTHTEGSVLGWTTTLVAAEPQGAVVGSTATLDRSHLIADEEFAAPLFDEVAHQIQVLMYPSVSGEERTVARVREIIEREKPAHVTYHLCIAKPELRVGIQARLGIDAIVSGERSPTRLTESDGSGGALVLGGSPPGRIGTRSQVGVSTRL